MQNRSLFELGSLYTWDIVIEENFFMRGGGGCGEWKISSTCTEALVPFI